MIKKISENEFTKAYSYEREKGTIEMYVSKAYDEDTDKHFLVANIVSIPELNVERIQYPISFETENNRDYALENEVNELWVEVFLDNIIDYIKNQKNEKV